MCDNILSHNSLRGHIKICSMKLFDTSNNVVHESLNNAINVENKKISNHSRRPASFDSGKIIQYVMIIHLKFVTFYHDNNTLSHILKLFMRTKENRCHRDVLLNFLNKILQARRSFLKDIARDAIRSEPREIVRKDATSAGCNCGFDAQNATWNAPPARTPIAT